VVEDKLVAKPEMWFKRGELSCEFYTFLRVFLLH
jgi:hypothetical protein